MRRDFVECAAGQVRLTDWCQGWIERVASIYRLNEARLAHYDPGIERQTPAFDAAQDALKEALDGLFAQAELELAGLPEEAREGKALRSLLNHREGLSVFVDRPQVPLDNNRAERFLRGPAIGRRLSFGSDSEDGARFTAIMYSVVGTLSMNGIDILSWLDAWLAACAENDRKPPGDLSPPDFSPKNSVESDYLLQTNSYRNFREATKIQGVFPFRAVFRPAAGGFARFRRAIARRPVSPSSFPCFATHR